MAGVSWWDVIPGYIKRLEEKIVILEEEKRSAEEAMENGIETVIYGMRDIIGRGKRLLDDYEQGKEIDHGRLMITYEDLKDWSI